MRVLVAGWFSLDDGATAGDLLVGDVICGWLDERGIAHDVAMGAGLGAGVDWFRVPPERYTHLVVACGPVSERLAVAAIVHRFARCRLVAINTSMVGDSSWDPWDAVIARDGAVGQAPRPDLALASAAPPVPVVARVRIHRQGEYANPRPEEAHAAFDRLLAARPAAAFDVDTNIDPAVPGRRTAGEVEALLARADVVLTTRLHGLVLALKHGIPAIAVDPVPGGQKVLAQARALGWPAARAVEDADDGWLAERFDWCLTPAAREAARRTAAARGPDLAAVRAALERALHPPAPTRAPSRSGLARLVARRTRSRG